MESAAEIARARLFPSIADPAYLTLRSRRLIFAGWARQFQNKRLNILDVGGRYQPYRPLFATSIGNYFAVDLIQTPLVSAVANAELLPFAPRSFDLAIATQVFEYLSDPVKTAQGIHEVLKPGGALLASFAACTPRAVDDERWRFTPTGLRSILEPFAKVDIVPELHSVAGLVRTVNLALDTFVRYQAARCVYRFTMSPMLNCMGLGLEAMNLTRNDQFTTNFSVMALKAE
ncbi:MAG: class I SAM-dependent methyltransferase [Terriglobales bacterium]